MINEIKKGFWDAMAQGISDMGGRMRPAPKDPEIEAAEFLDKALACLDDRRSLHARQGEAAALAAALREAQSRPEALREMLGAISLGLGADRKKVAVAVASIDWDDVDMSRIEQDLIDSLGGRRRKLCKLWLSMDGVLEFMCWLRQVVLAMGKSDVALGPLRRDLDEAMGDVFAQGLLQMRPISWRSPALVLEKIMARDKERSMSAWGDLKSRLDKDRRVYAVFHSGWPDEPLAFVEVALTRAMVASVADVAAPTPEGDAARAETATFYLIASTHPGLKGISFGEDLIRKSVKAISEELPRVKTFCALSPIPGFAAWLAGLSQERFAALAGADHLDKLAKKANIHSQAEWIRALREPRGQAATLDASKELLERLCAKYLSQSDSSSGRLDPVARFHLGNGARVEALRHLGDMSPRAMERSHGMMVSYLYDLAELDKNKIAEGAGALPSSWSVRRLAQS